MDINPIILSIPLYFTLIIIELMIQFFSRKKIYRINDAITNISCGISSQITGVFTKVLAIGVYQFFYENFAVISINDTWWSFLLLFIAVDFCYYWAHRSSHEVNFLWNGGHIVHHQSEDYNFSVALRQSSLDIWTLWFYVPLAIIGFDTYSFLLVKGLNLVYQFWIHTETINKLPKPIEWLFNTPSHHRVHHGRNPKYIDKNHAGVFMLWDRIFGTFQAEEERPTYGVTVPTNSWNPVWVNFQPYISMFSQVIKTSGTVNKLKVLFFKPGWNPNVFDVYQSPTLVKSTDKTKFNEQPALILAYYVIFQFIIVLAITSYFLFQVNTMSLSLKLMLSGFLIWSVSQLGMLLENRSAWVWLEYLRHVIIFGGLMYLSTAPLTIIFFLSVCAISIAYLVLVTVKINLKPYL